MSARIALCCLVLLVGCADQMANVALEEGNYPGSQAELPSTVRAKTLSADMGKQLTLDALVKQASATVEGEETPAVERKIIYEADVRIVVSEFGLVEESLPKLVKEYGGYVADVSIDRTSGDRRSGRWQVRIPVHRYDGFLESVSRIGVAESLKQTAEDVTEQFVDIEARITTKKQLEERILRLLDDPQGKITDIIQVERELARVRSEIEQMEGRLRYLANRTALTTVVINAREQRDYVPPESPTLSNRVSLAWDESVESLRNAGESLAVAAVYAAPWVVVVLIPALPIGLLRRRWKRKSLATQQKASGD